MKETNHQQTVRPYTLGATEAVVICPNHLYVPLTPEEYMNQLSKPDSFWKCPLCGYTAERPDQNYEVWCDDDTEECETCRGSGQVICKSCGGSGWVSGRYGEICCGGTDTCPTCDGDGYVKRSEM